MRLLIALLFAVPAFSASYTCTNVADSAAINTLLSSGGTVSITGPTCALGSTALVLNTTSTVMTAVGTVTMNYTGSGYGILVGANGVSGSPLTINGFILNNAGIRTTQTSTSVPQSYISVTNNTIQNVTNGANCMESDGYWSHFIITGNAFNTCSNVPIGSVTTSTNVDNGVGGYACNYPTVGANNCQGIGIHNENGADNTTIENNTFNFVLGDGIRIVWDWLISSGTSYHVAANVSISYNTFQNIHRMGIETGGGGACIGSCNFGNYTLQTNKKYAGNFLKTFLAPYGQSYAWSIPDGSPTPTVVNNSAVASAGNAAYCFEAAYNSVSTFQGNTCAANTGNNWNTYIMTGTSTGSMVYQNNLLIGAVAGGGNYFGQEGSCSGCWTNQYNVATASASCVAAGNCANSSLATGSGTITPSGTTATLSAFATDQIAVKNVQFTLDAALITTQEVQDQNTNFTTDQKWLYSHAFTGLSAGAHTVQAIATDVSGATSTTTQSFTIAGAATPNPINIGTNHLSHSTVGVNFFTDPQANPSATRARLRYGASNCSAGTGGTLQTPLALAPINEGAPGNNINLAALAPATTFHVCVELSDDGFATFSTGNDTTFTTTALPAIHPAKPMAPMTFDTSYPNTTGYFNDTQTDSSCNGFGQAYADAVARQGTQGTIIFVPAGTVCTGGPYAFEATPPAPGILPFLPAAVTIGSPGTIHIVGHGLSEGDLIQISRDYRLNDIYPASVSCPDEGGPGANGGILTGIRYSAHVLGVDDFQVRCPLTAPIYPGATPPTPPLMAFTTQGSVVGSEHFFITPWVQVNGLWTTRLKTIIVRTAGVVPPEHTQITPAWSSQMVKFVDPLANFGKDYGFGAFFIFGDRDLNVERPIGGIRIGPGVEITTEDAPESHTSADPTLWQYMIAAFPQNHNIVFDRAYIHPQPTPNRTNRGMLFDGSNMAIVDSYFQNLTYWHATTTGLLNTRTGNQTFTIGTGTSNIGAGSFAVASTVTGTISGSGTGEILIGFDLTNGGALTAWSPAGVTTTCTGMTCAVGTGAGATNGVCNAQDGWPRDSFGGTTAAIVGCVNVSSGVISTVIQAAPWFSNFNNEGCSWALLGIGPGPFMMLDTYSEGAGLTWHMDASGGTRIRGDHTLIRNYLYSPLKYMWGNPLNGNQALSDGLDYSVRQPLEWKGGQRQLLRGNVFDTTWTDGITTGLFIVQTPRDGGAVTDVEYVSNTFKHGPGVTANPYAICSNVTPPQVQVCAPPASRFWYHNNLAFDININYAAHNQQSGFSAFGWLLGSGGEATEDNVWDHNTFGGTHTGTLPVWLDWDEYKSEGWQFTSNIYDEAGIPTQFGSGTLSGNAAIQPGCAMSAADKVFLDCAFNSAYNFAGNIILGGYSNASITPTGQIPSSTLTTLYGTLLNTNSAVSSGGVQATIGSMKWFSPLITNSADFHLRYDSPYVAGSNPWGKQSDAGADLDQLSSDQGLLTLIGTPNNLISSSGFTVSYVAPDAAACNVGRSTTADITTAAWTADGGGARARNVALTGLSGSTAYSYWVLCSGNSVISQRQGQAKTH